MSAAPFTALLLAGGRSSRMGRDKALLPHPVSGLPLLAHQAALLRSLPGCGELLLSAPAERAYGLPDARRIDDLSPDAGPLGGVAAGLAVAAHPRVLVLAVDLPFVTREFLGRLLALADDAHGAAPRHPGGAFDPLCAVYSKTHHAPALAALARRELSLQRLLAASVAAGTLRPLPLAAADLALLANWNTPEDTSA